MSALLHFSPSFNGMRNICVDLEKIKTATTLIGWIREKLQITTDFRLVYTGRFVDEEEELQTDGIYHFSTSLYGGKGGFGSMLRAIGAQIEKTTNREACRDLSGRRMRDVNNEKKLKDWISKKADREQEREKARRERLTKRLAEPKHKFDDPNYELQKSQASESLEDALQAGLKKSSKATATVTSETQRKRQGQEEAEAGPSQAKVSRKSLEWMGLEGGSDLDIDVSDSDTDSLHSNEDSKCLENSAISACVKSSDGSNNSNSVSTDSPKLTDSENGMELASKSSSLLAMLPPPGSVTNPVSEVETPAIDPASVNIDDYNSAEELEKLGLNVLKSVLTLRGLKCGGTLQQRAERLFSVKGLNQDEVPHSLLAKPLNSKNGKKK